MFCYVTLRYIIFNEDYIYEHVQLKGEETLMISYRITS